MIRVKITIFDDSEPVAIFLNGVSEAHILPFYSASEIEVTDESAIIIVPQGRAARANEADIDEAYNQFNAALP
jgi:hypothetical protein